MRIINDARRVLILSYSFWAQVLGILVFIVSESLFKFGIYEADPYILGWLTFLLLWFGLIGRLVVQTGSALRNLLRIAAVTLLIVLASIGLARADPPPETKTLAIAVPFIAEKEGIRLVAYRDIVGVPTICAGSTRGVKMGMRKTLTECMALLRAEVKEYRRGLHRYYTDETRRMRLPPPRDAAFTSLAYNIGIGAAGRSTAVRRLNNADIPGACDALTWFNRAGKRVIRGLVLRRAEERKMCLRQA